MKNLEKSQNIYVVKNIIYIDYQKNKKRVRKSTGLKNSSFAMKFVKQNYENFLGDKKSVDNLKKIYQKLEDEMVLKKITIKEEGIKKDYGERGFKTIIEEFLKEKVFLKYNTKSFYKIICKFILNYLDERKIHTIDDFKRNDSVDFIIHLKDLNFSQVSIKRYSSVLKSIFNYAICINLIEKSPFFIPKMKQEIETNKGFNVFDLQDIKSVIKNSSGDLRIFLILGFFTGARTGEILALTFRDLDFKNQEISINKTLLNVGVVNSPKTLSSNRVIDMLDIVKEELLKIKFKNLDDRIIKKHRSVLRNEFDKVQNKLGLNRIRLYDTRHTFASIMLSRGEEPMWVGCKMMGHKTLNETFDTYAKYLPQDVKHRASFLKDFKI